MAQLELNTTLRRMGSERLARLVGVARLEAIEAIKPGVVTERRLVGLLENRYGTQMLAQRSVRHAVLDVLPEVEAGYVLDGERDPARTLSAPQHIELKSMNWGRSMASAKRLLEVFGLGDEYLPALAEMRPDREEVCANQQLFPYQRRIKDQMVRALAQRGARLLVHMPTGAGKTRTSVEGLFDLWRGSIDRAGFVVWLAHSEELCEQAVETISTLWQQRGDSTLVVHRLWGSHGVPDFTSSNGFVVASLQRLHALRTTSSNDVFRQIAALRKKCRIVVVDEAHKTIAPTYQAGIEFIADLDQTKIVGLTATPGRGLDNPETRELAAFYQENKLTLSGDDGAELEDPIDYLQTGGYLARLRRRRIPTQIAVDLTANERKFVAQFFEIPTSVLRRLAESAERNAIIVAEVGALFERGCQTIVFALSVDHAQLVSELLLLQGIEARSIDGGTPKYDRRRLIEDYKAGRVQVLVNYGVLTTGFDAPNTNAVVIARPTGSLVLYSQMIGRGIRGPRMRGNAECILVDLEDNLIGYPTESYAFAAFNGAWRTNQGE